MPAPGDAPPPGRLLALRTLGAPSLTLLGPDGRPTQSLEPSKLLALVTYLASTPGRSATREQLIDLLWSDRDVAAGKHALRQHLWHLHRRFGDALAIDRGETLVLRSPLDSDRDALLDAADRGDLPRVVELYAGDFFLGFAAPGSGEFERWADLERAHLRALFVRSAEALARHRLGEARFRDAVALARRVRDADLLQQRGWRLLLEALVASRDTLGAAVEADGLERLFTAEEMEFEPATRSAIALARQAAATAGTDERTSSEVVAELVGREREFAALVTAWEDARAGQPACLRIVAPAGFGKTRLLADFAARLRSRRTRIVHVGANPGASDIAFALAGDLAGALGQLPGAAAVSPAAAASLVALAPALAAVYAVAPETSSAGDATRHRMLALRELLGVVTDEHPVAVLVDDLHWSDAASRAVLAGAFGALEQRRVLVVVAERPVATANDAFAFARVVVLEPFAESDVLSLLTSLAALPAAPWTELLPPALRRATNGSPLLVLEALQLALERGLLGRDQSRWSCADWPALAAMLDDGGAVRHRVRQATSAERELLQFLALAGTALDEKVLVVARGGDLTAVGHLRALERRGLVTHRDGAWHLAHDEFAAAALENVSAGQSCRLHRALGRALAEHSGADPRRLRLAAAHLHQGGEVAYLQTLFVRYATGVRGVGDRRSSTELAAELLGPTATPKEVRALRRALPLMTRIGVWDARRVAIAGAVGVVAGFALAASIVAATRPSAPVPDQLLRVAWLDSAGVARAADFPLFEKEWEAHSASDWRAARTAVLHQRSSFDELRYAPRGPYLWSVTRAVSDSGVTDLFVADSSGRERRVTFARGDDIHGNWSPDGSSLVFSTSRWDRLGHTDIAVLELGSGRVRRLTSGDPSDVDPMWSPDGSQLAFSRRHWDGTPWELCRVRVDGSGLSCRATPDSTGWHARGWRGGGTLLVERDPSIRGGGGLFVLDLHRGEERRLAGFIGPYSVSHDGRWAACHCVLPGSDAPQWYVFPVDRPDQVRAVRLSPEPVRIRAFEWLVTRGAGEYVDSLALLRGPGEPRMGIPYRLTLRARDARGQPTPASAPIFQTSDPNVATVDSTGTLTPHRAGRVRIAASLGGWREAAIVLHVRENITATLQREIWGGDVEPRWVPFGEPRPYVGRRKNGDPYFVNGGDGTFASGVYSRRSFDLSNGLALQAHVSTPVTLGQWQTLTLGLIVGLDSVALAAWDHRTSYLFSDGRWSPSGPWCSIEYPGGPEGPLAAERIRTPEGELPAPPHLRTGQWFTVLLQWFPDGRCGLAIDGRAVAIGEPRPIANRTAHVMILGNSFETEMAVGALELFSGVRTGVDWSAVGDSARTRRTVPTVSR